MRSALLLCLALGLSGCYEMHEEVWVREDGSVRYVYDYAVRLDVLKEGLGVDGGNPDSILALSRKPPRAVVDGDSVFHREYTDSVLHHFVSERRLASTDRLVAAAARQEAREDSVKGIIQRATARRDSLLGVAAKMGPAGQALFDSISSDTTLAAVSNSRSETEEIMPAYAAAKVGGGRIRLSHLVHRLPDLTAGAGQEAVQAMHEMYADRTYTYRIHAPRIVSANGKVSADRRTVEWWFAMTALADSDHVLEATLELNSR